MWSTKIIVVLDDERKSEESRIREVVRKNKTSLENDLKNIIPQ